MAPTIACAKGLNHDVEFSFLGSVMNRLDHSETPGPRKPWRNLRKNCEGR